MSSIYQEEKFTPAHEASETHPTETASLSLPALFWPATALVLAVGLALRGQQLVTQREYPLDGPFFFLTAILLFLWGLNRLAQDQAGDLLSPPTQLTLPIPEKWPALQELFTSVAEYRWWASLIALLLSFLAYQGFAGNQFSTIGVIAWAGAIGSFLIAATDALAAHRRARLQNWLRSSPMEWLRTAAWRPSITWVHVALIGITLIAIFFRFHKLVEVPAEMTSDHAETYLEVDDMLRLGTRPIYFPRNTGHEALKFYLTLALMKLTPLTMSHLTLKVGTALFGVLAIPFMYLLGRALYNREVGLLAALLLAISQWHIAITRLGLRPAYTPTFVAATLYLFFQALTHNSRRDWLACGLVLGAGLHSYTAMRIVPPLLVALVSIKFIYDLASWLQGWLSRQTSPSSPEVSALTPGFWVNAILSGIAALLVFLPLLRVMRENPELFWYRVMTRSSDLERPVETDRLQIFIDNVKNAFLMFNYRGDVVWVNTVPEDPVLNWVIGALFVLGVGVLIWHFVQKGDRRSPYLFTALFFLLLPSILSLAFPQENPSLTRGGGAVVIAMLMAALPLGLVLSGLRQAFHENGRWIGWALVAVLIIVAGRATYDWYFIKYDQQYRRSAWNTTEMGRVIRGFADSIGDLAHAYHVAYPHWADTRNIALNAGDFSWRNAILDIEAVRNHVQDPAAKLYLVHPNDQASLSVLQSVFPNGQLKTYRSKTPEKDFLIFFVPAAPR